jgi:tRNA-specific 2-thiouridylase
MTRTRAVGVLSGGLDSILAFRLMLNQGIDVYALNYKSPFCTCTSKGCQHQSMASC